MHLFQRHVEVDHGDPFVCESHDSGTSCSQISALILNSFTVVSHHNAALGCTALAASCTHGPASTLELPFTAIREAPGDRSEANDENIAADCSPPRAVP